MGNLPITLGLGRQCVKHVRTDLTDLARVEALRAELTEQAQAILRALGSLDFVGMDVMEVAPAYDHAEVTALAAATIAWEYLSLMADPRRPERCAPSRATAT